jgi:hypothetical protein
MLLRLIVLALSMAILGDAPPAEAGQAPAPAGARVTRAAGPRGLAASHQGRKKRKKRRRVRRRPPVKPTRFQNVTPYQHLGPGVSR